MSLITCNNAEFYEESKSSNQDDLNADSEKAPNSKLRARSYPYYHLENNEDEFHHSKLGLHAFLLWKNNKVTDVTIKFNDKSYAAHKPVLSCYSTHFKERILGSDANQDVIVMDAPSITTDAFETLLYYMYTGRLELTCQNIGDVYTASRKLGIKTALSQCVDTFVGKTKPEVQPVYLYATAKKLNETATAEKSLITMARHFEQIVGTKEFLDLNFEEVREYLECDELAVRSEVVVYLAALKWLNVDFLNREKHIEHVIQCVRFSTMTLNEILACHSPPLLPGIVEMPEVQHTLLKATCYVAAKSVNEQKRFEKFSCMPRKYLIKKVPLLLWDPNIFVPERYAQYKREMAATIIQAGLRGYLAREEVKKLRSLRETSSSSMRSHSSLKEVQSEHLTLSSEISSTFVPSTLSESQKGLISSEVESNEDRVTTPHREFSPSEVEFNEGGATIFRKGSSPSGVESSEGGATVFRKVSSPSGVESSEGGATVFRKGSSPSETVSNEGDDKAFRESSLPSAAESSDDYGTVAPEGFALSETRYSAYSIPSSEELKKLGNIEKSVKQKYNQDFQSGMIIVLGGCDPSDPANFSISNIMSSYNPALDKWSEFGKMPVNRHHLCAVLYHSAIYIIGGCDFKSTAVIDMMPTDSCFKLELSTMAWSQIADMNHCRMFHNVAVVQDKIYVVGGLDNENKILDSIECYDVTENKWDLLTVRMSLPKMSVGVCAHKSQLWLAGGMMEDEAQNLRIVKEVEHYCPKANRMLHEVTDLPGPRSYVTLVECHGNVYSIGGGSFLSMSDEKISSLAEVNFYDDESKLWISSTPLPNPQHSVTATVFGGAIYVLGGITTYFPETASAEVIVYEPSKDVWAKCESLPVPLEATCAVTIPSGFLVEELPLSE